VESGKYDSSCLPITTRAFPATLEEQEELHIQQIGNKEKVKKNILIDPRARVRY
jgi:hypothetical protein